MLVLVLLAIPPATAPPDRVDALERRLVEVGVVERMAEYAALACDALADATNEFERQWAAGVMAWILEDWGMAENEAADAEEAITDLCPWVTR